MQFCRFLSGPTNPGGDVALPVGVMVAIDPPEHLRGHAEVVSAASPPRDARLHHPGRGRVTQNVRDDVGAKRRLATDPVPYSPLAL